MTRQPILFLLLLSLTCCQDEIPSGNGTTRDCSLDSFIIDSVSSRQSTKTEINEPIAIEFFQLSKTIKQQSDSLPKKLRDNIGLVHRIDDQFGAYSALVKPKLESLKIKTVEADFIDSLITFNFKNSRYTININCFKDTDGVLLFKPGKNQFSGHWSGHQTCATKVHSSTITLAENNKTPVNSAQCRKAKEAAFPKRRLF